MKGYLLISLMGASLLAGCQGSDRGAPSVSGIAPAVIPTYGGFEIAILGDGFLPNTHISALDAQADIKRQGFSVRLNPIRNFDENCAGQSTFLSDVTWHGVGELRGVVPSALCPGEYQVVVEDPNDGQSSESILLTLTDHWPDHLVLSDTPCQESLSDQSQGALVVSAGESATFSLRVVGPEGQAVSTMPPGITSVIPLTIPVSAELIAVETGVGVAQFEGASLHAVQMSQTQISGKLAESGCADFVVSAQEAGLFEIESDGQGLPQKGGGAPNPGYLNIHDEGDLSLALLAPAEAIAGQPFDLTVIATHDELAASELGTISPATEVSACAELGATDQDLYIEAGLQSGCPEQSIRLEGGMWQGKVRLNTAHNMVYLRALASYGQADLFGFSNGLLVNEGLIETLRVETPAVVEAGIPFTITVSGDDGFGNRVALAPDSNLVIEDLTQTLTCPAPVAEEALLVYQGCVLEQVLAGNRVSVGLGDTLNGLSPLFDTISGPPAALNMFVDQTEITAGDQLNLHIEVVDAHGNLSTSSNNKLYFRLGGKSIEVTNPYLDDGVLLTDVVITTAGEDLQFEAILSLTEGITDREVLQVKANAAAEFEVAHPLGNGQFEAGSMFGLTVTPIDAYGNRVSDYESEGPLLVSDSTETLDVTVEMSDFSAYGFSQGYVAITKAGDDISITVEDSQTGLVGVLGGIEIFPGPHVGFTIADPEPYYWRAEPFELEIRAVDIYDNTVTNFQGQVDYSDGTGSIMPAQSGPFHNGVRREIFHIGDVSEGNLLTVDYGGLPGDTDIFVTESLPFLVLQSCDDVLSVDLDFPSVADDWPAVCLPSRLNGAQVSATAEVEGTGGPGVGALFYIWTIDSRLVHDSLYGEYQFEFDEEGQYTAGVTVYRNDNLCAYRSEEILYVGYDDGGLVGPLSLSTDVVELNAGLADGTEKATVNITGKTCGGDAPSGLNELTVMTNYGELKMVDSAPLQSGLQTNTDMSGATSLLLSVANEQQETTLKMRAVGENFSAFGHLEIPVRNDTLPPFVVDYGPTGQVEFGFVDSAFVEFSEPMRPELFDNNPYLTVYVESGESFNLNEGEDYFIELDESLTKMTIQFLPEGIGLDVRESLVTVVLPSGLSGSSLSDLKGNPLDRDWDGLEDCSGCSFQFKFGQTQDTIKPVVTECDSVFNIFSPDGQDGEAFDRDYFEVSATISDDKMTPLTWRFTIRDRQRNRIFRIFDIVATGQAVNSPGLASKVEAIIRWNGETMGGPIAENGTYWYTVDAIDQAGNLSAESCDGWLEIANPIPQ